MDGAETSAVPAPERAPEPASQAMRTGIDGAVRAAISRAIVRIHAEHYGKGATQAKTYAFDNLIVTVLRDVFTTVERTLIDLDRPDTVREVRTTFQTMMAGSFVQAIEELTGRKVESFMSQIDPTSGMGVEVFVLVPEPDARAQSAPRSVPGSPSAPA
jgi:uncharacterized protein YbcI